MIEFGIHNSGRGGTFQDMKRVWLEAERLGFDYAWCADNVVGPMVGAEGSEAFDFWSVGGALAEATKRIRFGPMATPCGRRHPALFAKMTSMMDVISEGRFELGMGPGDLGHQFLPWGMNFPAKTSERIEVLREEIQILKLMWTREHASFVGKYYKIDDAYNSPKPVQKPHPPLWIGIQELGRRLMPRLVAEHADGVNLQGIHDDEEAKRRLETVANYCREFGRDFDRLRKSRVVRLILTEEDMEYAHRWREEARRLGATEDHMQMIYSRERRVWGPSDRATEELSKIIDIGVNQIVFRLGGGWMAGPDAQIASMRVFAKEIMPALRSKYASV